MIQTTSVSDAWLGRTAKLEYDNAIEFAGHLDWDKAADKPDILPGMVVKSLGNKELALYDGTGTPFGLAAIFVAPKYGKRGINQLDEDGNFTAIVGTNNTTVRVWNDALSTDFKKAFADDKGTLTPVYAGEDGKLTTKDSGSGVVGVLNEFDDDSVVIQLYAPTASATPAAGGSTTPTA